MIDLPPGGAEPISGLGTSLASSGGAAGLLWLLLRGKFDSINLLWKKMDALGEKVTENRLADSKEYATRVELASALGKLETHLDQRFNTLEAQIKELKRHP